MDRNTLSYSSTQAFLLAVLALNNLLHLTPIIGYTKLYSIVSLCVVIVSMQLYIFHVARTGLSIKFSHLSYYIFIMLACILFLHSLRTFYSFILYIAWPFYLIITAPQHLLIQSLYYFRSLFAYVLLPGIILYPIILIGADFSIGHVLPNHEGKLKAGIFYINYIFTYVLSNSILSVEGLTFSRLSSLFDEPGYVGTFSALLLMATSFQRSFLNVVLFLGGLLSFSFAFIILVLAYLVLHRKWLFIFFLIAVMSLVYLILDHPYTTKLITNKIIIDESGYLRDNRTTLKFDAQFDIFMNSPRIWLGQPEPVTSAGYYVSSWKNLIWDYGIIGFGAVLSFYLLYALKYRMSMNRYTLSFLLIFLVNIYHRPYIVNVSYFLVYAGGLALIMNRDVLPGISANIEQANAQGKLAHTGF